MKAVLEFDLNDEFEKEAYERCNKALDMALLIYGTEDLMREYMNKYFDPEEYVNPKDVLEQFWQDYLELTRRYGLESIDDYLS